MLKDRLRTPPQIASGQGEPLQQRIQPERRFKPVGALGTGGLATVRLGERADGSLVAIKTYDLLHKNPHLTTEDLGSVKEQLTQAATIYGELDHPNIAKLQEVLPDGSLVMDHVPGKTLKERIQETGRMRPQEALTYARQVLEVLAYMHGEGVTNNDIKLSNIMLHDDKKNGRKKGKVIDFDAVHKKGTLLGESLGSPVYVAPERMKGEMPTEKSDVYSAGVVLYIALTGEKPFEPDTEVLSTDQITRAASIEGDYTRASSRNQLSQAAPLEDKIGSEHMTPLLRAVEPLVMRSLSYVPEDRPTAREFSDTLATLAAEQRAPISPGQFTDIKDARLGPDELEKVRENLAAFFKSADDAEATKVAEQSRVRGGDAAVPARTRFTFPEPELYVPRHSVIDSPTQQVALEEVGRQQLAMGENTMRLGLATEEPTQKISRMPRERAWKLLVQEDIDSPPVVDGEPTQKIPRRKEKRRRGWSLFNPNPRFDSRLRPLHHLFTEDVHAPIPAGERRGPKTSTLVWGNVGLAGAGLAGAGVIGWLTVIAPIIAAIL